MVIRILHPQQEVGIPDLEKAARDVAIAAGIDGIGDELHGRVEHLRDRARGVEGGEGYQDECAVAQGAHAVGVGGGSWGVEGAFRGRAGWGRRGALVR